MSRFGAKFGIGNAILFLNITIIPFDVVSDILPHLVHAKRNHHASEAFILDGAHGIGVYQGNRGEVGPRFDDLMLQDPVAAGSVNRLMAGPCRSLEYFDPTPSYISEPSRF